MRTAPQLQLVVRVADVAATTDSTPIVCSLYVLAYAPGQIISRSAP